MQKVICAALSTLALIGCAATTPTPPASAVPVPADRVSRYQVPPSGDFGTLIVTRDAGFIGSACHYSLGINGDLVARLATEETARFYLPPGEYVLKAGRDPLGRGLCAMAQDQWSQQETLLRASETKRFRLRINGDGMPDIQRAE